MASIPLTPEFLLRIIGRTEKEYGQSAISNFALSMLLDDANELVAVKQKEVDEWIMRCKTIQEKYEQALLEIEGYKIERDPARGDRFKKPKLETVGGPN